MQRIDAFHLLEIDPEADVDSEDIIDSYQEKLIPVKQYWLTNPVIEALFIKRLQQAKELNDASALLLRQEPVFETALAINENILLDEANLVRDYEFQLMQLKQKISACWSISNLSGLVLAVIKLQHAFEGRLQKLVIEVFGEKTKWPINYNNEVKLAQQLPTIEVSRILAKNLRELSVNDEFLLLSEALRIEKRMLLKSTV